jgi:Lamin Tail Domain
MRWLLIACVCYYSGLYGQEPARYDLVIQEIFADPTPSHGLPPAEYIEIRNRGSLEINLKNWSVSNGNTSGRINANISLKPDSILLLCPAAYLSQFNSFGTSVALSPWPSINNDGDTLILLSPPGLTIHAVAWNKQWYGNEFKASGGWSIEMKDIRLPCLGRENWAASVDIKGGTPGQTNSMAAIVGDTVAPLLLYSYMPDSISLALVFSEPLNPVSIPTVLLFHPELTILSSSLSPPLFNSLVITFRDPLPEADLYLLQSEGLTDCMNNRSIMIDTHFGKSSAINPMDIIINEILFNPRPGGFDYIELFNKSNKIIDAYGLYLANRNEMGRISSFRQVSAFPFPILPGEFLVITENAQWLLKQYGIPGFKAAEPLSLPSFPDDNGTVVLLDDKALVADELQYDEKWHFALISNREGVALERIRANAPTQDAFNWHSAATAAGYGTPGYQNSQSMVATSVSGPVTISSPLISPDMDGRDDFIFINYNFPAPGYIANITVFDGTGRPVRYLARNSLCGTSGHFRWDGTGEMGTKLQIGNYIILTDVFLLSGKTKRFRNTVGLVGSK